MDNDAATTLVERIDALLPQTQCRRCGYDGCRPYARAIAQGSATINQCPPGGDDTVAALSKLLGVPLLPLDRARGESGPLLSARIDETACIGCALCIAACPVDAIVGAAKLMHTVLAERCTGCELCVPPCPVDCIALVPLARPWTRSANGIRCPKSAPSSATGMAMSASLTPRSSIEMPTNPTVTCGRFAGSVSIL